MNPEQPDKFPDKSAEKTPNKSPGENPDKKIDAQVEKLCGLGCTQVNQLIDDASKGKKIEALADFSQAEVSLIIYELTVIMSVYDKNDSGDDCGNDSADDSGDD